MVTLVSTPQWQVAVIPGLYGLTCGNEVAGCQQPRLRWEIMATLCHPTPNLVLAGQVEVARTRWLDWGGQTEVVRLRRPDWRSHTEVTRLRWPEREGQNKVARQKWSDWGGQTEEALLKWPDWVGQNKMARLRWPDWGNMSSLPTGFCAIQCSGLCGKRGPYLPWQAYPIRGSSAVRLPIVHPSQAVPQLVRFHSKEPPRNYSHRWN